MSASAEIRELRLDAHAKELTEREELLVRRRREVEARELLVREQTEASERLVLQREHAERDLESVNERLREARRLLELAKKDKERTLSQAEDALAIVKSLTGDYPSFAALCERLEERLHNADMAEAILPPSISSQLSQAVRLLRKSKSDESLSEALRLLSEIVALLNRLE